MEKGQNRILYLECRSGISGDMTVAALLDLGADEQYIREQLQKLPVKGYEIQVSRTVKCGISACKFDVILEKETDTGLKHHHEHTEQRYVHTHEHRSYRQIAKMIQESQMDAQVKELSQRIFAILAEAESTVHGVEMEQVHFHEVGAVDSIVDTVAVAAAVCSLKIKETVVSPLTEGQGTVWCQHGRIPVPVPAVLELVKCHGLKMHISETSGEMITPTGAAIAAALRTRESLPEEFQIEKTGYGAGTKDFSHANVLRAMILSVSMEENLWVLETNVDDFSGEQMGYLMETLFEAGLRDVWYEPIYMKKNRPAYILRALCTPDLIETAEDLIFRESTSIGIRRYPVYRSIMSREIRNVQTEHGEVQVKICHWKNQKSVYPEYTSIRELCKKEHCSYREAYDYIRKAGERSIV